MLIISLLFITIISFNNSFSQEILEKGKQFEQSANLNFKFYKYDKAIIEFNEAEKLLELSDISVYNRAMSYYHLKKYDSSLINFDIFIKRNNDDLINLVNKSKLQFCFLNGALGNYDKMIDELKLIINEYDSDDIRMYPDLIEIIYENKPSSFNLVSDALFCIAQMTIKKKFPEKYKDLNIENCKKKIEELENQ